ncbi:MAG: hypothetical protein ACTHMZ_01130 [Actinomycetes bacterium]
MVATCARCGAAEPPETQQVSESDRPALLALHAWSVLRDQPGRQELLCPACTREHLRSIEGRLDQAWW